MVYLDFNEWWVSRTETASKKRQDGSQQDSGDLGLLAGSAVGLLGDLGQSVDPPLCLHLGSGNTDASQLCRLARLRGRTGQEPGILLCKELQGPVFHFFLQENKEVRPLKLSHREQGSMRCRVGIWIFAFHTSYTSSQLLDFYGFLTSFPLFPVSFFPLSKVMISC